MQFGFGAVGKSFYEKVSQEIQFDEHKYYVITRDKYEFDPFIELGGMAANFIVSEVTRANFAEVFEPYLSEGDLLIDFADTVGTKDFLDWCANRNIMYINTGEADWPDNWYSIFNENELKNELRQKHAENPQTNRYPIVLQHGNNPGLVSHFVKAGIEYLANTGFKKDKLLKGLIKEGKFNEAAKRMGITTIHVNDIDSQKVKAEYNDSVLFSTWCTDSFWFEMLSEATAAVGTHEVVDYEEECNFYQKEKGFLEFKKLAADIKCKTVYPNGVFKGYLVPHEETVTIAKSLEVKEGEEVIYRPTVLFLYEPCEYARRYFERAKVNDYPNPDPAKPMDCEIPGQPCIIRGYLYPDNAEMVYREHITEGTEYVGVLLMGEGFDPVWVGNRIETSYLYKNKKKSYWQTPTITPVAMSALAAVCWMLKHKNQGGIYFPDDIPDYKFLIHTAEKYISKTIYQTIPLEKVKKELGISSGAVQIKDLMVKPEKE